MLSAKAQRLLLSTPPPNKVYSQTNQRLFSEPPWLLKRDFDRVHVYKCDWKVLLVKLNKVVIAYIHTRQAVHIARISFLTFILYFLNFKSGIYYNILFKLGEQQQHATMLFWQLKIICDSMNYTEWWDINNSTCPSDYMIGSTEFSILQLNFTPTRTIWSEYFVNLNLLLCERLYDVRKHLWINLFEFD